VHCETDIVALGNNKILIKSIIQ